MKDADIKRKSIRWKDHSYNSSFSYFVTICTHEKQKIFGAVIDKEMKLSEIGMLAEQEWLKSFEIRKEVSCPAYCIMPNHIHAIITINNTDKENSPFNNNILPKSVSSFVGGFKAAVTLALRKQDISFAIWQKRFFDRVIRDHHEFRYIENYIVMNPVVWDQNEEI